MKENSKHEISDSFYKKGVENEKNKNLTKAVFFYQKSLTENHTNNPSIEALLGIIWDEKTNKYISIDKKISLIKKYSKIYLQIK